MDIRTLTALTALEFPFLHTRTLFDRASRNLLTAPYDDPKLTQLDFQASAAPVHCFWSGPKPNEIASLALRSFVHHGHAVHLYTYDAPEALARHVPSGVAVRDASDVVPRAVYEACLARSEVRYFSDIFRYAALYRFGGWWVDTDVVLLRSLPAVDRYFFCSQWNGIEAGHLLVGDVLHAPRACTHMLTLYRMSLANLLDPDGDRSFGAIGPKLLTDYVLTRAPELKRHVFSPTLFNTIDWTEIDLFHAPHRDALELASDPRVIGLHLWNKVWTERGVTLADAQPGSLAFLLGEHYATPNRLARLAAQYGSDKGTTYKGAPSHHYTRVYQTLFETRMLQPVKILEIGLCRGLFEGWKQDDIPSLRMWLDFFPSASVFGVDISDFSWYSNERVQIFRADASSEASLRENVVNNLKGTQLDIVIDDGSHASWDQQVTFKQLFPLVAPGGLYIIEDLDWQPPLAADAPQTPPTKTLLEYFGGTGRLPSAVWSRDESDALAAQIEAVEFHDSFSELVNRNLCGGLAVIRKKR
ncbi:MAG: glycosyltransferase [Pseudomonadota bacterium]